MNSAKKSKVQPHKRIKDVGNNKPLCSQCRKRYVGECKASTNKCYTWGKKDIMPRIVFLIPKVRTVMLSRGLKETNCIRFKFRHKLKSLVLVKGD